MGWGPAQREEVGVEGLQYLVASDAQHLKKKKNRKGGQSFFCFMCRRRETRPGPCSAWLCSPRCSGNSRGDGIWGSDAARGSGDPCSPSAALALLQQEAAAARCLQPAGLKGANEGGGDLGCTRVFALWQGRARLDELGLCPEATSPLGGGTVGRSHPGLLAVCGFRC